MAWSGLQIGLPQKGALLLASRRKLKKAEQQELRKAFSRSVQRGGGR